MKKVLFILLLIPFLAYGGNVKNVNGVLDSSIKTTLGVAVAGIKTMCGGDYNDSDCAGDCCDNFNRADNADAATGSPLTWTETDVNGKLAISSNTLQYSADTSGQNGYILVANCVTGTEVTIKFRISIHDITNLGNWGVLGVARLLDASDNPLASYRISNNGSGTLDTIDCRRENLDNCTSQALTMVADTWYDAVAYYKKDNTTGGLSFKIGANATSDSGFDDDTDDATHGTPAKLLLGGIQSTFGTGTTDTFIYIDDVVIYNYDAR